MNKEKLVREIERFLSTDKHRAQLESAKETFQVMTGIVLECIPEQFSDKNEMYEKGDEQAPFYSEAYLYNLLGKMDARTILSLMRQLGTKLGFSYEEMGF